MYKIYFSRAQFTYFYSKEYIKSMMKTMKNNKLCFLNLPRIKDDRTFDYINKPHINNFLSLLQNG